MAIGVAQVVLVAILGSGVGLLGFGALALVQRQWLRSRSETSGELAPGLLGVTGRARSIDPDETVRSPITGGSALLYEYVVQRRVGSSQTPEWRTVTGGQNGMSFRVETNRGAVVVDPRGAGLELPVRDEVTFVAAPDEISPDDPPLDAVAVDREAETVVIGDVPLENGERYRVVERRIEPGDELTVAGVAIAAQTTAGGADGPAGERGPTVAFRKQRGRLRQFVGIPYVIGDADGGADIRLRNRAIIGAIFGLPLVMLSIVYLVSM